MAVLGPWEVLLVMVVGVALGCARWASRDAQRRTGSRLASALTGVGVVVTFPIGMIAYVHLRHRL